MSWMTIILVVLALAAGAAYYFISKWMEKR
jgi:uncharacterized protein YneF (UPF0154 family)